MSTFNDAYEKCLFDLSTLLENGGEHLNNLPSFLEKISHLDIGGRRELRGRLDWEELQNRIYKRFVTSVKHNIENHLGCVSPLIKALTNFFNPVLVPNLLNHSTYLNREISILFVNIFVKNIQDFKYHLKDRN